MTDSHRATAQALRELAACGASATVVASSDSGSPLQRVRQLRDRMLLRRFRLACVRAQILGRDLGTELLELFESLTPAYRERLFALLDQALYPTDR